MCLCVYVCVCVCVCVCIYIYIYSANWWLTQNPLAVSFRLAMGNLKAAAAAKSLQSCLTLCDPIDRSPPGSPVPGILQARILEWVAISFSNAWKWKVKVKSLYNLELGICMVGVANWLETKNLRMFSHSKLLEKRSLLRWGKQNFFICVSINWIYLKLK